MQKKQTMKAPEFEHGSVVYRFNALTVGQMELLAGLLHEQRKSLFAEMTGTGGSAGDLNKMLKVTVKVADVVFELHRHGKLCEFVAVCMQPKGKGFNADEITERASVFKQLPYDKAADVIRFFFTTGAFAKLLMPDFLTQVPGTPSRAGTPKSTSSSGRSAKAKPGASEP